VLSISTRKKPVKAEYSPTPPHGQPPRGGGVAGADDEELIKRFKHRVFKIVRAIKEKDWASLYSPDYEEIVNDIIKMIYEFDRRGLLVRIALPITWEGYIKDAYKMREHNQLLLYLTYLLLCLPPYIPMH